MRSTAVTIEGLVGTQGRVELGWMVKQPFMSKARIKILLNLALIAADALVRAGALSVGAEGGEIVVRAEGERIVFDPELKTALLGKTDAEALTPKAAAAWLVHILVREGGGEVQIFKPEENVLLFGVTFAG